MSITTTGGTTVSLEPCEDCAGTEVIIDHPDAPDHLRHHRVGTVTERGGFQTSTWGNIALMPDVLRAIADIIDHIRGEIGTQ